MGSVAVFIPVNKQLPVGVQIQGCVACCICSGTIDQFHVDQGEAFFATGKKSVYPAHVVHFYTLDPVTNKVDVPTEDYDENLKLFAIAYGVGEGLQTPRRG